MSYSSIVHCIAVVRVEARLIIFTTCCTFTVYTTWQVRCVTTSTYTASHNDTIDYSTHCEYY